MTTETKLDHSACVLSTSFALLHEADACKNRYVHLAKALGGITAYGKDTPIPLTLVLETNGLNDALWAFWAVQPEQRKLSQRVARLFATDCLERVLHLYERECPNDARPRKAIEAMREFARGELPIEQLTTVCDAATAAVRDASRAAAQAGNSLVDTSLDLAYVAFRAAAQAAVRDASGVAASATADDAAWAAAQAAARAAACNTFWFAAYAAARAAERKFQQGRLIRYLTEGA